jgi:Tol biopolymer transport system component
VLNHADGDFVLTRFTRGSIFAFATGEGGYYSNLTLIDVGDGSIRDLTPDLFSLQPTSVAVSPDGSTLFYVRVDSRGSRLLKRVLSTKKETVLYSVPPKDRSKGEISIGYVVMPPAGSNLVFARADATGHRERTIEISTTSGRASTLLDTTQNNVVPWHWSQDERFLWMEPGCTGCPESATSDYALDVATKQLHVTWTPTDTSQSIDFVGWIR